MIAYVLVIVAAWSVGFGGLVWMLWRSSAPVATLAVAYVLGFAGWSLFVASAGWHIFTISCW